ncbi:hypothetical protein MUK42_25574 [Musa troglodytarum]|uniref:Uncharacterized protein n=2 Tax=Musa troglodytarum TaxID=320322 RepID=A0A9E7KV87_9LILI|nr:hypothetical protein MUK42_25574 [Musa troglodytarum]
MRRMIEEDHLLFAQKAAARIRAKALKEEDHRRFEELLKKMMEEEEQTGGGGGNKEPGIGIKDWWTRSKYAYLNQPTVVSAGENAAPKRPAFTSPRPRSASVPHHSEFIGRSSSDDGGGGDRRPALILSKNRL